MRTTTIEPTTSSNELAHYGVIGMKHYQHKFGKWQRQAQYAAGQPDPDAKQLNRNLKRGTIAKGVGQAEKRLAEWDKEQAILKNNPKKFKKAERRINRAEEVQKQGQAIIDAQIKKAQEMGLDVKSTTKSKYYYTGKTLLRQFLFGPIGAAVSMERERVDTAKVTAPKNKTDKQVVKPEAKPQEGTKLSKSQKHDLVMKALDDDVFDLNFLETVQNDTFDDHSAMVKEYEKYLDDPMKYMSSH